MKILTSRDGTEIAYTLSGGGQPIIFAAGAFNDHTTCAPVSALLRDDFTVVDYDRRARGESGDTRPYAVEREVEDLEALLELTGPAALFGFSSGALLALHAATITERVTHVIAFDAPIGNPITGDLPQRMQTALDQGRPGDVVALFQTEVVRFPPEQVEQARRSPMWPALEAIAQSVVYDVTLSYRLSHPEKVAQPVLALNGEATWEGLIGPARAYAESLGKGEHRLLPGGANHSIPAEATAAAIRDFLSRHPA